MTIGTTQAKRVFISGGKQICNNPIKLIKSLFIQEKIKLNGYKMLILFFQTKIYKKLKVKDFKIKKKYNQLHLNINKYYDF